MERWAEISSDGRYRYSLDRAWGHDGIHVTWVMLNPSTADGYTDDPTIRRCIDFTKRFGGERMKVVNLYALRATDPRELLEAEDPMGPENADYVKQAILVTDLVIAAWGGFWLAKMTPLHGRLSIESLCRWAKVPLRCLGVTKYGAPRHPLYLNRETEPVPFGVWETA